MPAHRNTHLGAYERRTAPRPTPFTRAFQRALVQDLDTPTTLDDDSSAYFHTEAVYHLTGGVTDTRRVARQSARWD